MSFYTCKQLKSDLQDLGNPTIFEVPEKYDTFDSRLFAGSNVTDVILPKHLKYIPERCFAESKIKRIVIPDKVNSIGSSAFVNCRQLEQVVFPKSLEYIGSWAFSHCFRLNNLDLPPYIKFISGFAFNSTSVKEIHFNEPTRAQISRCTFNSCKNLENANLYNAKFNSFDWFIFDGCANLKEITLPDTLKELDFNMFKYVDSLKINISKNTEIINFTKDANPSIVINTYDNFLEQLLNGNITFKETNKLALENNIVR